MQGPEKAPGDDTLRGKFLPESLRTKAELIVLRTRFKQGKKGLTKPYPDMRPETPQKQKTEPVQKRIPETRPRPKEGPILNAADPIYRSRRFEKPSDGQRTIVSNAAEGFFSRRHDKPSGLPSDYSGPVIVIDASANVQRLYVYDRGQGKIAAFYPVSTGSRGTGTKKDSYRTPTGDFLIHSVLGDGTRGEAFYKGSSIGVLKDNELFSDNLPQDVQDRAPGLGAVMTTHVLT